MIELKRKGFIFEKIVTTENIKRAHEKARKDKTYYDEVKMIDRNPTYYFKKIRKMLIDKTYTVGPNNYKVFTKIDKGKEREIYKLDYYPHRIIQWALMLQIQDILLKSFIRNTFSSIPKRGIHDARKTIHRDMQNKNETLYCLKADVKKFYPSINHKVVKGQIRRKIKDQDVLWLCDLFIDSMGGSKGVAIGALFSQWLGNLNLNPLDHWLKEIKGIKYYYRYCDDVVILHHNKTFLHGIKHEIKSYLKDLELDFKGNEQVFPTFIRGIDFVGYRFFGDYVLLRKNTAKELKRKMSRLLKRCEKGVQMNYGEWCSVNSYRGWVMYCNGYNLDEKYIKPLLPYADKYYKEVIKGESERNPKKRKAS